MPGELLFGDILDRDRFREDFQRGVEFVFFPTRNGPQLFRRDGTGFLRRMRIPQQLTFIDISRKLIAICEDCFFNIHRLPCDWRSRYLRPNNGPQYAGLASAALASFNPEGPGIATLPAFAGAGLVDGCLNGNCGGGTFAASQTLVQEDLLVSGSGLGVSAFDGLGAPVGFNAANLNYPNGFF
jgi:hypothetical protein